MSALALAFGILAAGSLRPPQAAGTYQVRLVATPVTNTAPSFVAPARRLSRLDRLVQGRLQDVHVRPACPGRTPTSTPDPSGSYYNPAAEGEYIVFQGATTGGYDDIYLYDRDAARRRRSSAPWASTGISDDWNPRIQGGRVVWEKDTADPATGSGIYLYDIATP